MEQGALYRTIWRWHFYAGLFVVPMVLVLALTGTAYLFQPQVERWEEHAFRGLAVQGAVAPTRQVEAALARYPGARFQSYRLPGAPGDASLVHVALGAGEQTMRDVFVSPQGDVVGTLDPEQRIMAVIRRLHGQLLLGPRGSWLVELAASWAIVMVLSGLYLWWPAGAKLAGVVWPRLRSGRQAFWRDLHAVTGFWASGLALVLLLTGLPWADVWGSAFKAIRAEMGWVRGGQGWTTGGRPAEGGEHEAHDHAAMTADAHAVAGGMHIMPDGTLMTNAMTPVSLNLVVATARGERLPFPVVIVPPGRGAAWTVRSDTPNRPQRVTLNYDAMTGREIARETFADKHPIDRVIGYGIAWHEGQLLGPLNQLIGVLTTIMLLTLAASGFVLWRRRKPEGMLGAPPAPVIPGRHGGLVAIVVLLAAFLPLLAASLVVFWLLEEVVLRRFGKLANWLGLQSAGRSLTPTR